MIFFCYLYLLCSIFIEAVKIDGNVLIKQENFEPYKTGESLNSIEDIRRISKKWRSLQLIVTDYPDREVPADFDCRDRWPQCKSIERIRKQGRCGWCWAIVSASTATDRLCISTNGSDTFEYSPVYLLTCCKRCKEGANDTEALRKNPCDGGGSTFTAMYFLGDSGGLSEDCIPETPSITEDGSAPPCEDKCTESNDAARRFLRGVRLFLLSGESRLNYTKQLQIDIMLKGPVVARIQAPIHFQRFFREQHSSDAIYKETVYKNAKEKEVSHVVKMVGWGQENGIPYWICANSWGTSWGNKGFFKIIRGQNLLDIERIIFAPYNKLPLPPPTTTTTTTTTLISPIDLNYSCAKMVTIPKIIFLLAVIIIL